MTRPPSDRGQGRKALPVADKLVVGSIRLSPAQWVKLEALGGAAWLRERIDKARVIPSFEDQICDPKNAPATRSK